MTNNSSTDRFTPVILDRRHQATSSGHGLVTVVVWDHVQATPTREEFYVWRFSFAPEPGDVLAQVEQRLQR